jgi:hypothetical protein
MAARLVVHLAVYWAAPLAEQWAVTSADRTAESLVAWMDSMTAL